MEAPTRANTRNTHLHHRPLTFGVELEFAVPTLLGDDDEDRRYRDRPLNLIERARKKYKLTEGPIRGHFEDAPNEVGPWAERTALDVWVPGSIFMTDLVARTPRPNTRKRVRVLPEWVSERRGRLSKQDWYDCWVKPAQPLFPGHTLKARRRRRRGKIWLIEPDFSLLPPLMAEDDPRRDCKWMPMEINSRILEVGKDAFGEVVNVVRTLGTTAANANSSTGVHVHVGNGTESKGFSLDTLKCFVGAMYVFEPQIEELHPAWRCGWDLEKAKYIERGDGEFYCKSIRRFVGTEPPEEDPEYEARPVRLRFSEEFRGDAAAVRQAARNRTIHDKSSLTRIFRYLMGAESVNQLIAHISTSKYFAYNLMELESCCGGGCNCLFYKRTIEFRQHAGTLNSRRVKMWTRFCTAIVAFSKYIADRGEASMAEYYGWLEDEMRRQCSPQQACMPLKQLFNIIGIDDEEMRSDGYFDMLSRDSWGRRGTAELDVDQGGQVTLEYRHLYQVRHIVERQEGRRGEGIYHQIFVIQKDLDSGRYLLPLPLPYAEGYDTDEEEFRVRAVSWTESEKAADSTEMTYEEALACIGASADDSADHIKAYAVAAALVKDRRTVSAALLVIGNTRGDVSLQNAGAAMVSEASDDE